MPALPSGTVTFLFTDIEGSTSRWEQDSPATRVAIERHFALLDDAIRSHNGVRYKRIGDAVQAAFPTAPDAVAAAITAQRALAGEDWGALGPIAVRMAIHTGTAVPRDGDYLTPVLNRLARLLAAAHGEQVVLTEATRNLVREFLPDDVQLRDLGEHRLRDLRQAGRIYQVVAPDLRADFPLLKSLDRRRNNLPADLTPFIGREREVDEVAHLLRQPDVRLLTVSGSGGTGKTRLALRVAADLTEQYDDGVWFVALGSVSSPSQVAGTIAETLGLRETPGEPIAATLRAYLGRKQLLLILDNFEHVLEAAPLLTDLLTTCPELQMLVTSRARLRISGEHEFSLLPLGLPPADQAVRLDDAFASEAVRLFVERARAVRADFTLTDGNVADVVAICRRLDGLPLAIELAAARMRLLSPEAILARLDNQLTLLTGGERDRPERQQTLRGTIAWSYDLLDTTERALFRRLAVFAGGWTLDAAEIVATVPDDMEIPVLDCLAALNDNSLVYQEESEHFTTTEPRFGMLQTMREFGLEQLAAHDEEDPVRNAHAALFAALAVEAEPHLVGPDAISWLDRLDTDYDNARAALDWLRQHDAIRAAELAAALWRFWWLRGHISEGRTLLEDVLTLDATREAPATRAAALDGAGVLAETQGEYDRAAELHEEALTLSRDAGDNRGTARALGNLGVVAFDRGDYDLAVSQLEESLELARAVGDQTMIATALTDLGNVARVQGDFSAAEASHRESLELRRKIGNQTEIARSLNNLGAVAFDRGQFAAARALFEESLELYRQSGDPWGAAGALNGLGVAIQHEGDARRASELLEESLTLFEQAGDTRNAAVTRLNLGDAARARDDLSRAREHYREALLGSQQTDDRAGIVEGLAGLGSILVKEDRHEEAAWLLGAAASLCEEISLLGVSMKPPTFDADLADVRAALPPDRFDRAWKAGYASSVEAAIHEATASPAGVGA